MTDETNEIIARYCKETHFIIGSSRSALERFIEWQISKCSASSEIDLTHLLHVIKAETQPIEGHTDQGALEDCWNEAFEISANQSARIAALTLAVGEGLEREKKLRDALEDAAVELCRENHGLPEHSVFDKCDMQSCKNIRALIAETAPATEAGK